MCTKIVWEDMNPTVSARPIMYWIEKEFTIDPYKKLQLIKIRDSNLWKNIGTGQNRFAGIFYGVISIWSI